MTGDVRPKYLPIEIAGPADGINAAGSLTGLRHVPLAALETNLHHYTEYSEAGRQKRLDVKTAKALGIEVPTSLLLRADDYIE